MEPCLQAGKYAAALMSQMPRRNGWTIAEHAGDRAPDKTQRLLNRAVWDAAAAAGVVRRFAVAGLDQAGGRRGLVVGAVDETGQVKQGGHTAGVKRHYLGCAGKVANGITTVHVAYVREKAGHALVAARQWIPREHIDDPAKQQIMGLPDDLVFRTKGQLAIDLLAEVFADGIWLDFVCGDEVYGACTRLREYLEGRGQGYVLRVPSNFHLTMARGVRLSCKQAATRLLASGRSWETRSAGKGSKGARWYAWAWLATISPRHYLLVRRHLITGELATGSDATGPASSGCARSTAISARQSPPSASVTTRSAMIFPGSCTARGARHLASPPDRPSPRPVTRAASASSTAPAWDTSPLPSADTVIFGRRAVFCTG